jgi:hypothetical protein
VQGNEYFDFDGFQATIDETQQIFEYRFLVKKPLPDDCFIFEHFSNDEHFWPSGECPLVPGTQWTPGTYVHRTRQFLPKGQYELFLGMTFPDSGARLHIDRTIDHRLSLGRVHIPLLDLAKAQAALAADTAWLSRLREGGFPLYLSPEQKVVAWPERGTSPHRVAVISVPKAGSYLLEKLLEQFGYRNCKLHLSISHINDYRNATMEQMLDVMRYIRASQTTQLVDRGQSIVGHILHCPEAKVALFDFKKIFVFRNLRDVVVSALRWGIRLKLYDSIVDLESYPQGEQLAKYLKICGEERRQEYEAVIGWRDEADDVLKISFEEIMGDYGRERQADSVKAVARHVEADMDDATITQVMAKVIGADTMTFSGKRSQRDIYWNNEVERRFCELGFDDLNRRLGY